MAYDEGLAQRIRELVDDAQDVVEKRMFGGLCFMVSESMAFGIVGEELMVRLPPAEEAHNLARPGARPMDFTGKRMKGFVYVSADGIADDEALRDWVARSAAYARSLPPRPKKAPKGARTGAGKPAPKVQGAGKPAPKAKGAE